MSGPTPKGVIKRCEVCGAEMYIKQSHLKRRKTCSKECDGERKKSIYKGENNPNYGNRGANNPMFKGDRRISKYGYYELYRPDHPNAKKDGWIFEHRLIMSEYLGRPLAEYEHVHHIDENKLNNDFNNLKVMSMSEHIKYHNSKKELVRDELGRIIGYKLKEAE